MCTAFSFPGIEQPGSEVDHLPLSIAEAKNDWRNTSTPPCCLHDVQLNNFIVTFYYGLLLLNGFVSSSDNTVSNGRMINEE
jgi:hypothetical protein